MPSPLSAVISSWHHGTTANDSTAAGARSRSVRDLGKGPPKPLGDQSFALLGEGGWLGSPRMVGGWGGGALRKWAPKSKS